MAPEQANAKPGYTRAVSGDEPVELRTLREDEREPVLDLLESAFGLRQLFAAYMDHDTSYRRDDFHVASLGGQLVSCVQIFSKRIRLRGRVVGLGGIGSVATHPQHRGRGLASTLLRRAIEDMRGREMVISLLFSDRRSFYGRLGWLPIAQPRLAIHAPAVDAAPPLSVHMRPVRPEDLPAVYALYDDYASRLEAATVRDEVYWRGQLRYAGAPSECFRVAERDGAVVAYARSVVLSGVTLAMEYARRADAADALAALLVALAPGSGALVAPRAPDPELDRALARRAARTDPLEDPSTLWRVLDRVTLCELAGLPDTTSDARLLEDLVGQPAALYWPSDRF
jgi:predicted N-acetyltransferase YhbS